MADVRVENLTRNFGDGDRPERRLLRGRGRGVPDPARTVRLRQVHDARCACRARPPDRRDASPSARAWSSTAPRRLRRRAVPQLRPHVPVLCAVAAHDGLQEPRLHAGAADASAAPRRASASPRRSRWSRWRLCRSLSRRAFRRPAAARGAGAHARLPAGDPAARRASLQPRRQARANARASGSASCSAAPASPPSTSRTTSPRRWR